MSKVVSQILYYNQAQQYPQIQRDYRGVKKHVDKSDSADVNIEKAAIESIPTFRRIASLPDNIQNGDALPALGLASLALINLPEDLRDVKSAWNQVTDKNFKPSYNYKEAQHPFSFFRGTMLHNWVDPNKTKNPNLAKKLLKADITMAKTSFGQKILNLLGVTQCGTLETQIATIGSTKENPRFLRAIKYEGSAFGKLTARALNRTTLIGTAALAAIELPKIFQAMGQGDNISEQTGNTVKQTVKSGINIAALTTALAYAGAIGARYGGSVGSIVGMSIGAVLGSIASKKLQESIS